MGSEFDWELLGSRSSTHTPSCGTPTERASEAGTASSVVAGSEEATRILLAPSSPRPTSAAGRDCLTAPWRLPVDARCTAPTAPTASLSSQRARQGAPRRQATSSLRIAQRMAKLPARGPGACLLLQRLALRRVTAELAAAQCSLRRMDRQLSAATSDASGLATQLGQVQRLLHGTRGELERGDYELGMARSLLQQYHRAVEQLLRALAAAREGGAAEGQPPLDHALVAAVQKLRVTNLQLEASRYVLDVCQDAMAAADPAGGLSLVASVKHTTTSTTMTTTSDHLLHPPGPPPLAVSPPPPPSCPSPCPSRTPTPPLAPTTGTLTLAPPQPPLVAALSSPRSRCPSFESAAHLHQHHHHHTVTTTTTTTAVSTRVTLTRPTPPPAPPHPSLGTAQAAWQSYFAAISVALDDPRQHTLAMVPLLLAALLHTIARNILHANLAYWAAVAAVPRALLLLPLATLRPRARGGVCGGLAGVAVAYLDYALAMACAGLEILNATTAAACCVTHTAHVHLAQALAPPPAPTAHPTPAAPPSRWWPARAAYAVLAAKGGVLAAAAWGALGLWHLVISACCVLLGTCNLLASLFAAAVRRCAAGAGYLPARLVAADLAQPLYQSSARSLALCSLTGLHGCTYLYWAHLALCGAWLRVAALPRVLAGMVWCPVAACVRAVGRALLLLAAAPGKQ